jgi:hypothetical protein
MVGLLFIFIHKRIIRKPNTPYDGGIGGGCQYANYPCEL